MYRGLVIATVICVCMAVVLVLEIGHTPAEWQHLRKAKTRADIHPVLDRYRQYGLLDDSNQSDVMAIDRGWRDLWSQNWISVDYEGSGEMEHNRVLRVELQRVSVIRRMAMSIFSSDP